MGAVMKIEWEVLVLILGMVAITLLYMPPVDSIEQASNIIAMEYTKDQKGNCYAYQSNTPKFSWIPCELTK